MPYENEWSEWSATNWEEYTNLPAKDYTFEVKAMNVYGNESVVSRYNFTINPEWYETNLAYAAYASLILFFLHPYYWFGSENIKSKNDLSILLKKK